MSPLVERLRRRWERSMTVLRAPRVRIDLYGGPEARAAYEAFTARHRVFRMTAAKRWGVALVRLPASFDEYLAGGSMEYLRRQRRRAEKAGYRYGQVSPHAHLDAILEINRSAPTRQGRAMSGSYLDPDQVARAFADHQDVRAILDADGRLRAYADVPVIGDAFVYSRILGHADHLDRGVMYLLVSEVIREHIEAAREGKPGPSWAMYDTFWGASPGLAYFKERAGFRPYTVDWVWRDQSTV
jgi:hypothetical protein